MASCLFGYLNAATIGAIVAASAQAALPASNLGTPHADTASSWQTPDGVVRYINGARFSIDSLSDASRWRAFVLTGTNLSSGALIRWRAGPVEAIVEPGAPAIEIDFTAADSFTAPALGTFAWTRTTVGWRCRADGVWEEVPVATPRIHHNPKTLRRQGALYEPTSTNRIRNPRGEGLVAPSTAPTYMAATTAGGLALAWVGTGIEDGLPGFYVKVTGTATAGAAARIYLETASGIAGSSGQAAPVSAFLWRKAGSTVGVTPAMGFEELDGSATLLATRIGTNLFFEGGIGTGRAGDSRRFYRAAVGNASTTNVRPFVELQVATGAVADITLFIGAAQCETGVTAPTSPMLPPLGTPGPQQRTLDGVVYTPPAGTLTATGTMYCEWCSIVGHPGSQAAAIAMQIDDGTNNNRIYMRGAANFISGANGGYGGVAGTEAVVVLAGSTVHDPAGVQAIGADNLTLDLDNPIRMACAYGGGLPLTQAFFGQMNPDTYAGSLPASFSRITASPNQSQILCLTRWRLYQERLSDGRLLGLATDGIAVDPAAATYDSGWVSGLVVPGFQRAVVVAPAEVVGRCARCDIQDPANEDGFIAAALAYAGPVWQPQVSVGWATAWNPQRGGTQTVTRGGQEHVEPLWRRGGWDLTMDWITDADMRAEQQAMEQVAATGANILFVPDPADAAGAARETVLGTMKPSSGLGYPAPTTAGRNWRAQIVDRL